MQNNELVKGNQKLQKELSVLRTLAKEAIVEKKKSQTALETLKHQVVHLLGQHDMVTKQELAKKREGERQEPRTSALTGDLCSSNWLLWVFTANLFWACCCEQAVCEDAGCDAATLCMQIMKVVC